MTGPDEYSAVADNNVYTNLMAQQNLRAAADAAARPPDVAQRWASRPRRSASWRDAAAPWSSPTTSGSACTRRARASPTTPVGLRAHADRPVPAAAALPVLRPVPQAGGQAGRPGAGDAPGGDAFTAEEKLRNFDYYEALTVRDSSLSACTQAVMAAEVGYLELAHDYLAEAALMDLDDLQRTTPATACTWPRWPGRGPRWSRASAACGPGGPLSVRPGCRAGISRLSFRVRYRGRGSSRPTAAATYRLRTARPAPSTTARPSS